MKKLVFLSLFSVILWFSACTPEEEVTPDTGDSRDNITDAWQCQENSSTYGTQNYYVDISKDSASSSKIIIDNFFGLGTGKEVEASMSGLTLTISNYIIQGYTINGTGSISSNYKTINWQYTVDEGNGAESVTATYTKL